MDRRLYFFIYMELPCGYKIGRLKPVVYLLQDVEYLVNDYKVNILRANVSKLDCDLVTFNETESYSGRFKFTTTVTATINKVFDDTEIRSNDYKVVVETEEGLQYIVSPEFDAFYTSDFQINDEEVVYQLIFTTQSNIPARILSNPLNTNTILNPASCEYIYPGVNKLYIWNESNQEEEISFLTCQYSKTFNGSYYNISIVFTIPVIDTNWYYELINFPDNNWNVRLKTCSNDTIIEYRLFPQYTIQTSEELSTLNTNTITLSGRVWAGIDNLALEGDFYCYIPTDEFICDGFDKYVKLIQLKNENNQWVETGVVRKGALLEENSEDCGYKDDGIYEWEQTDIDEDYACIGTDKYYVLKLKVSTDGGITWEYTGSTQIGDLYQKDSPDCGFEGEDWRLVDGYICEPYEPEITWVDVDGYICDPVGNGLYRQYKKQQKYVNGKPAEPAEYRRGELIGIGYWPSLADCSDTPLGDNRFIAQLQFEDPSGLKGKLVRIHVYISTTSGNEVEYATVDWGDGTKERKPAQLTGAGDRYPAVFEHTYEKELTSAVVTITASFFSTEVEVNTWAVAGTYPIWIDILSIGDLRGPMLTKVVQRSYANGGNEYLRHVGPDLLGEYSKFINKYINVNPPVVGIVPSVYNECNIQVKGWDAINNIPNKSFDYNWLTYASIEGKSLYRLGGHKNSYPSDFLRIYFPYLVYITEGGLGLYSDGNGELRDWVPADFKYTKDYLFTYPDRFFDNLSLLKELDLYYGNNLKIQNVPNLEKLRIRFLPEGIPSYTDPILAYDIVLEEGFIRDLPNLNNVFALFREAPIKSLPNDLFVGCPALQEASSLCAGCKELTSIPSTLFSDWDGAMLDLDYAFSGCVNLTGSTPVDSQGRKLWERGNIRGEGCFTGCKKLTDYDEIPRNWK